MSERFALMVRVGPIMLTHYGLFVRCTIPTANGKYTTVDYVHVVTGEREHERRMRLEAKGRIRR